MIHKKIAVLFLMSVGFAELSYGDTMDYVENGVMYDSAHSEPSIADNAVINMEHQAINPSKVNFVSVYDFIKTHPGVTYQTVVPALPFNFDPYPLSVLPEEQPYQGTFSETFMLTVPQGRVCSKSGWVVIDNCFLTELIWKYKQLGLKDFTKTKFENVQKVSGRVVVLAQRGGYCYFHWITEVLGRLAMVEMSGIEYDYIYVPTYKPFMKDSLILWGVDPSKIIEADETNYIQADELIVPSLVSKIDEGYTKFASYVPPYVVEYVKEKLVRKAQEQNIASDFSKRVFITRKDAPNLLRQTTNEDEVFALFEAKGFKCYSLSNLSVLEQIMLFQNAEVVVGCHGAGLTNTIFCNQGTQVIEFFQARGSATYWYISQMLGLRHECVKTTDFDVVRNGFLDTEIPLSIVVDIVARL